MLIEYALAINIFDFDGLNMGSKFLMYSCLRKGCVFNNAKQIKKYEYYNLIIIQDKAYYIKTFFSFRNNTF